MTFKLVLSVLLSLPIYHRDQDGQEKRDQLAAIASAVATETQSADEAAFVLTLGSFESHYSLDVHSGKCAAKRCDPDRNGVPRARSPWQLHRNGLDDETWSRMVGVENTKFQVREAAKRARWAIRECRGDIRGAFVVLGGRACSASIPGVEERVKTFRKVRARL